MLSNLAVFYSPKIIVSSWFTTKGPFTYCKTVISVCKYLISLIINHLNALFAKSFKRCSESGKPISNSCVVLNISISIKIAGQLFRMLATENITYKRRDNFACFFCIYKFFFHSTVNLGTTRWIWLCLCSKIIPMLSNFSVAVKAENIECYLLTSTCKIINSL